MVVRDFTLYRGTAPTLRFVMPAGSNIRAWTAQLTFRTDVTQPDPPALLKDAVISDDELAFEVELTVEETLSLDTRTYVFSLVRTNSHAEHPLTMGVVTVLSDIRHAL